MIDSLKVLVIDEASDAARTTGTRTTPTDVTSTPGGHASPFDDHKTSQTGQKNNRNR
jgi:hypothetical protein